MSDKSTTPSYVFSYIPTPKTISSASTSVPATPATPSSSTSLYAFPSAFVSSLQKALTPISVEQQRITTLQQTKTRMEEHAAFKTRAGIPVSASEREHLESVAGALRGLEAQGKSA